MDIKGKYSDKLSTASTPGRDCGEFKNLQINEIFHSIQGEGSYIGWPCTFIRLTGCNLRCHWCDTSYSFYEGQKKSFYDIWDAVQNYTCRLIEVTGGEPLIQKSVFPLFDFLHSKGCQLLLETSGSVSIEKVPKFVHIVMDLKAPGSGESGRNYWNNIPLLKSSDDLKFVVSDENDLYWAEEIYLKYNLRHRLDKPVIVQPVFNEGKPLFRLDHLSEFIKHSKAAFRLGVQLHKYIYPEERKGV